MPVYNQGDPRQKIQVCVNCNEPTGNCEEDSLYIGIEETGQNSGPFCSKCYEMFNGLNGKNEVQGG